MCAVVLKCAVVDCDGLDADPPAGFETPLQALKIGRPIGFADGFEHFDGDNMIKLIFAVAVILQA